MDEMSDNAVSIEDGKFYCTRDGQHVGPMRASDSPWVFLCRNRYWYDNGLRWNGATSALDLVAEWDPSLAAPSSTEIS